MWQHKLPISLCSLLTFLCVASAAQLPGYAPSAPIQYYHYPAPRNQLTIPAAAATSTQQQYQRQYASYSQTQQQYVQQQARQQQQFRTQPAISSYYQQQQQRQTASAAANVAQQFAAPALENAAFTTALTRQGYAYGGGSHGAAASTSAARALPIPAALQSSIAEALGNDLATDGAIDLTDSSINLQLPLPVNIAPIKAEPLPLQAGASFKELGNGVTSYGTIYPQRKRR